MTAADRSGQHEDVTLGIRPEDFRISDNDDGIPVKVTMVEELGADAYLYGVLDDPGADTITSATNVVVRVETRRHFQKGEVVTVTAEPAKIYVFDTGNGERVDSAVPV